MKKRFTSFLAAALTMSLLSTPASAFYVDMTSFTADPFTGKTTSQTLYVKQADGNYEKLSVYDEQGNQLYIQVGNSEWEKLDTPLPPEEVARQWAEEQAAAEAARVKKKAELEQTYHIQITEDFAQSTVRLEDLDRQFQRIPAPLREKVTAQLTAMGKTLKVEDMRNSVSEMSVYTGFYRPEKVQIEIDPFTATSPLIHEYGHLIFMTVLPRLYNSAALQQEWNALTGGEGPTHVSDYAATDYHEDLAETFDAILTGSVEYYSGVKDMTFQYPDCLAVKKINYLRQLLCEVFSLDSSLFPDYTPSYPSTWAEAGIAEYQSTLGGGQDSVVPYPGSSHSTSYQTGATRVQFVYAICEDLIRNLRLSGFFGDMTYLEYESKWQPTVEKVNGVYQIPFTDVNPSTVPSYFAVRAIHALTSNAVMSGKAPSTFDPNGGLTRQEAATILYQLCRALGHKLPAGGTHTFADADQIAPWAQEAVGAIYAAGIMSGVGENRFNPTGIYTCEQSALCLLKTYKLLT